MDALYSYWSGALRRLQAEVDAFSRLVRHSGERGRENEIALARVLSSLIPNRFGTGSGVLIDRHSAQSPQTDVIVYERTMEAALFAQTTQLMFPIEACYATIEVKTTLRAADIDDASEIAAKMAELNPARQHADETSRPISCLFAYSAWAYPSIVMKHLLQLPDERRPDLFCVVDAGLVGGRNGLLGWNDGDGYGAGQTFLMGVEDGEAKAVAASQASGQEILNGTAYTVFRRSKEEALLVDPARGLLVFLEAMLRAIHRKVDQDDPILSLYLGGEMRIVEAVTPAP